MQKAQIHRDKQDKEQYALILEIANLATNTVLKGYNRGNALAPCLVSTLVGKGMELKARYKETGEGSFEGYLRFHLFKDAQDEMRKYNARKRSFLQNVEDIGKLVNETPERPERQAMVKRTRKALTHLSERDKQFALLLSEHKPTEAARMMGITRGQMRGAMERIEKILLAEKVFSANFTKRYRESK